MTELEKAARMALEQLEFLNACYPHKTAADTITALTQALATTEPVCACGDRPASQCDEEWGPQCDLGNNPTYARPATTERTVDDVLSDIDAATCPECNGLGITAPGEPDSPDGHGRAEVPCKPCKGTGWRNGVPLSDQQPATTERKGEQVFLVATGEIYEGEETYQRYEGSPPPLCDFEVLYTSPQVPEDVQKDAERYRFLAEKCRSTSEHWGGRWSIVIEGPAPKLHDSKDDLDAAIDAARKGE